MSKRHICCLSGGKDSTALAIYMKERLEEDLELVWCDTGREPPSLYNFIDELREKISDVVRLHGGWHCKDCDKYGTDPTARDCPECGGEIRERDMDYYMNRWSDDASGPFLPGANSRWCTTHLKIYPFERYVKQGDRDAIVYIGIRADEDRGGNYGDIDGIDYRYPFVEDGIDLGDVRSILQEAEIELPKYYQWRSTGGCYCCPFQKISDWMGLKQVHPELFQKALKEEENSDYTWNQSVSLKQIDRQKQLNFDLEEMELREEIWQGTLEGGCGTIMCGK